MVEAGDKVKILYKDEVLEGILMPEAQGSETSRAPKDKLLSDKKGFLDLKLSSGYNVGLDKRFIKKIELLQKKKALKTSSNKVAVDKKKKTIAILHTGGTIASKVDYETGGVIAKFSTEELLGLFPELKNIANIKSVFVSNMMSEDMRFKDYQKIARAVKKEVDGKVDGVIIGHGTDTLAVTAAALAFMLENVQIPVLVTGSQRSSDRGSTDSAMNIICAAEFIAKTSFKGVAICMHENTSDDKCLVMPATKTRKLHSSRRDAFKVINEKAIARVDYANKKIDWINKPKENKEQFVLKDGFEDKVAVLRTYNNMNSDFLDVLTAKKYKGLVLEATGIGQAPTNVKENLPNYVALKKFIKNGGVVVLTSQCIFGRVHKDIYANCRRLANIGVIFGEDLLTETAHVKLAWLLGNYKKAEVEKLITMNLRGEITKRTEKDTFLR